MLLPHLGFFVHAVGLAPLEFGLVRCHVDTRVGWVVAVPPEGVAARKEITAAGAEGESHGMRLRCIAVLLETFPVPEPCVGAELALQHVDGPALPVCLRCRQQGPVPLV